MIEAGQLNVPVALERATETRNTDGGVVYTWAQIAKLWAEIKPLTGRELLLAQQMNSLVTHNVRVRYRAGINNKDRFVGIGDSRVFNVAYAVNVDSMNHEYQCQCIEQT